MQLVRAPSRRRLGDILREAGLVTEPQLAAALAQQAHSGQRLGEVLVEQAIIDGFTCVRALAMQLQLPVVDVDHVAVQADALKVVPRDLIERYRVLPMRVLRRRKVLQVASADPNNAAVRSALMFHSGLAVEFSLSEETAIARAIRRHYYGERDEPKPRLADLPDGVTKMLLALRFPETKTLARGERDPAMDRVQALERVVTRQSMALRAMLELLDTQGVVRREDFLARMQASRIQPPPLPLSASGTRRPARLPAAH